VRNRYAMVLGTYACKEYAWTLVAIPFWILITAQLGGRSGDRSFLLGPGWAFLGCLFLNFSALLLSGHLIGMIGTARGRITPVLAQAHLVVAAAIAGVLTIVIPLGQSLAVSGWRGPHLAVISLALVVFSIPCYLPYWNRWAAVVWCFLPFAAPFFGWNFAAWAPTNAESLLLLPVSCACLFGAAKRCLNLEAADLTFQGRAGMDRRQALGSNFHRLWVFAPSRLRWPDRGGSAADEGLWQRAKHWDAAWWNIRLATLLGTLGGMLLAVMAYSDKTSQDDVLGRLMFFLIPLCACFPVAWVANPPWRVYWINEFLRPYSRRKHVGTAGFALAVSSLVGSCLLMAIPFLAIWIATGICPVTRETLCAIAIALCGSPLFFALCAANWPAFRGFLCLALVLIVYATAVWTPLCNPHGVSNEGVAIRAIVLVVSGAGLTMAAYRSWLDRDVA